MWRLLLGTMGVKSLVQGLNAAATAGFEPRTVWSEVRRRNRLATASPYVYACVPMCWSSFLCMYLWIFLQTCHGIAAWRYYPWVNWQTSTDNGQLRSVTYIKQRNDTILRVTFHSTLSQYNHQGCSQWYIQFGGQDCTQPAPITTSIYKYHSDSSHSTNMAPAEVSGFYSCNLSTPACNASGLQTFHPKLCEASSVVEKRTGHKLHLLYNTTLTLTLSANARNNGLQKLVILVVSGFCNATSSGKLSPGNIQVSVHVKHCSQHYTGDAQTGTNVGQWTSYLLIEEYCPM